MRDGILVLTQKDSDVKLEKKVQVSIAARILKECLPSLPLKRRKTKRKSKVISLRHFCTSLTYVLCEIGSVILLHQNNDCVGVEPPGVSVRNPCPWSVFLKGYHSFKSFVFL
jgi:hypothetical protein